MLKMSTRRKILLAPEQARYRPNDITFEPSGGASSARSRVDAQDSGMSRDGTPLVPMPLVT
jgi:hypothetical protein